ncbi:MAG TPA: hypothetical protein VN605_03850, partial [Thermoanaerobaculia bacterium]|nr:hypothetical protein [Thermoanaerobaculia bacterium]
AHTLLEHGRPAEALRVYETIALVAEKLGATETLAHILNNVGVCAVSLGDLDRAETCFGIAYKMFEDINLTAELPRVRGGKVLVLTARGRYNEAVSVLFEIRRQFLDFGMPIVAALVSLDIVENLYLAGRTSQIASLCEEMVMTFTAASLRQNAMKALAYLTDLARQRPVVPDDVQLVRTFLTRLDAEPEAMFELSH